MPITNIENSNIEKIIRKKRKRTVNISVNFTNGYAEGWIFGVNDSFRSALDIIYSQIADRKANREKKKALGRKLRDSEISYRMVWTQGVPPALSFHEGDMLYDPPGISEMPWHEAADVVQRAVQVMRATPDLIASDAKKADEASDSDYAAEEDVLTDGFVTFILMHYKDGHVVKKESGEATQREFAEMLRTGTVITNDLI